ncbi:MAG: hypothetical protein Q8P02_00405 [Candidatus Micrarchaeota archaeon]|nr:hypothetical protein [Candidatus Micrarchaeota archaeon]
MVSRPTLIKYGTLALILFFIGSSLYPLLYSSSPADVSPTPDASALSFTAAADTPARITALGFTAVAFCSPGLLPAEQVKKLANVTNALYATESLLAVTLEPDSDLSALSGIVASACQAPLFRSAFLEVASVTLNTSSGTQVLTSRQMQAFAQSQGLPGVQGFVSAAAQVNQTINATLEVSVQQNVIASISIQEVPDSAVFVPQATVLPDANRTPDANAVNDSTADAAGAFGSNNSAPDNTVLPSSGAAVDSNAS